MLKRKEMFKHVPLKLTNFGRSLAILKQSIVLITITSWIISLIVVINKGPLDWKGKPRPFHTFVLVQLPSDLKTKVRTAVNYYQSRGAWRVIEHQVKKEKGILYFCLSSDTVNIIDYDKNFALLSVLFVGVNFNLPSFSLAFAPLIRSPSALHSRSW